MINNEDMTRVSVGLNNLADRFDSIAEDPTAGDYTAGLVKGVADSLYIAEAIIRSMGSVDGREEFQRLTRRIEDTGSWVPPRKEDREDFTSGFEEGRATGAEIANCVLSLIFESWQVAERDPEGE